MEGADKSGSEVSTKHIDVFAILGLAEDAALHLTLDLIGRKRLQQRLLFSGRRLRRPNGARKCMDLTDLRGLVADGHASFATQNLSSHRNRGIAKLGASRAAGEPDDETREDRREQTATHAVPARPGNVLRQDRLAPRAAMNWGMP